MAGLWIPRRADKPPVGARINWQHPLAQGLIGYWPLNEGARNPCNLAAPHLPSVVRASPPWASTIEGIGLTFPTVSAAAYAVELAPVTAYNAMFPPITVVCRAIQRTVTNNLLYSTRLGATFGWELLLGGGGVTGAVTPRWQVQGPADLIPSSVPVLSSAEYNAPATYVTLFDYNGVSTGVSLNALTSTGRILSSNRDSESGLLSTTTNQQPLTIGERNTIHLNSASVFYMAIYNRLLSDADQMWLHAEPYAMLTR